MLCLPLAAGCCTSSLAGSVFIHDWSVPRTNSGHWDCQALRLQPAWRGTDPGQAELALLERHLRDSGIWHAGELQQSTVSSSVMWQRLIGASVVVSLVYWMLGCCAFYTAFHHCCYPMRNEGAVVVFKEAGGLWCSGNKEMGWLEWEMDLQ